MIARLLVVLMTIVFLGCSSGSDEGAPVTSGDGASVTSGDGAPTATTGDGATAATGDGASVTAGDGAPTTVATPELSDERLRILFENAGSTPAVAACYAQVIVAAGYSSIVDLDDVSRALETMPEDTRAEMDACLVAQ